MFDQNCYYDFHTFNSYHLSLRLVQFLTCEFKKKLKIRISVKYMFLYIGHYKNFTYIGPI